MVAGATRSPGSPTPSVGPVQHVRAAAAAAAMMRPLSARRLSFLRSPSPTRTCKVSPQASSVLNGGVGELRALFQCMGDQLFLTRDNGWLLSHAAARAGKLEVLQFIAAEHGHETLTATTSTHSLTPAHLAARGGHTDVLTFLVAEAGREVLAQVDSDGWTPAHSAARGGSVAALRLIVEQLGAEAVLERRPFRPTVEKVAALAVAGGKEVLRYLAIQAERIEYELQLDDSTTVTTNQDCEYSSDTETVNSGLRSCERL